MFCLYRYGLPLSFQFCWIMYLFSCSWNKADVNYCVLSLSWQKCDCVCAWSSSVMPYEVILQLRASIDCCGAWAMLHRTEISSPLPHFAYGELWQRNQSHVPVKSRNGLLFVSFLLCCCLLHISFQAEYTECYDNAFLRSLSEFWVPLTVFIFQTTWALVLRNSGAMDTETKSKHIAPAALCLFYSLLAAS